MRKIPNAFKSVDSAGTSAFPLKRECVVSDGSDEWFLLWMCFNGSTKLHARVVLIAKRSALSTWTGMAQVIVGYRERGSIFVGKFHVGVASFKTAQLKNVFCQIQASDDLQTG